MKWLCGFFFVALTMGFATQAHAWLNDSEEPGSVLVFPKFIRGTAADTGVSGQLVFANTEFEISVLCPSGATCSNDIVRMRAHWVCPGCSESSFDLVTTVGGTLYFNPEGVTVIAGQVTANAYPSNVTTPIPAPLCQRGYLIVWVVDGSGNPIKFDGLIGDAIIRAPTPFFGPTTARAYNALPIQASANLNTGDFTDVNADGAMQFDGTEYQAVTGTIYGSVRYENSVATEGVVQTDITLLTLDSTLDFQNPVTTVGLNFYTANEQLVDAATSFTCWTERRLTDILPSLTEQQMGRKGLVTSTYAQQQIDSSTTGPVTLLGIVETQEGYIGVGLPGRSFAYWLYNDSNPVATTFAPSGGGGAVAAPISDPPPPAPAPTPFPTTGSLPGVSPPTLP
jgi:hypothetical protein